VNANGPQDLIVFALGKRGRIEATNYRVVKVPSDFDVPLFVKDDFANFYRATFDRAVARENMRADTSRSKRAPRGGAPNAPHPAACAVRCGLVSGGPHLRRDRRPREFSGPLHHAASGGHRTKLSGGRGIPGRTTGALEARGTNAG